MDKARPCEHLVWNVDALDRMSGHSAFGDDLRCRARFGVVVERDVTGQLPITGPDIAGARDRAVMDVEQRRIDAETFGCCDEEALADLGTGVAQRAAGLLDRKAARCDAFVRA